MHAYFKTLRTVAILRSVLAHWFLYYRNLICLRQWKNERCKEAIETSYKELIMHICIYIFTYMNIV